jgi:hypothetical protein
MEKFNQIEAEILKKIEKINNRNSNDITKSEIFGKKGTKTELFKKVEV